MFPLACDGNIHMCGIFLSELKCFSVRFTDTDGTLDVSGKPGRAKQHGQATPECTFVAAGELALVALTDELLAKPVEVINRLSSLLCSPFVSTTFASGTWRPSLSLVEFSCLVDRLSRLFDGADSTQDSSDGQRLLFWSHLV